ncbi:ribosome silencing factor [Candidatus Sumerlaeota bacterium]|nr:ribosome silencing factor [Candidatus Sumerlaeota bacterium]
MTEKTRENQLTSNDAIEMARIADQEKAEDVMILDMRGLVNFTDFFVLCNGHTRTHQRRIGNAIEKALKDRGHKCFNSAGYRDTDWVVLDFSDIVVHIFTEETRGFYALERLWADAEAVEWAPEEEDSRASASAN